MEIFCMKRHLQVGDSNTDEDEKGKSNTDEDEDEKGISNTVDSLPLVNKSKKSNIGRPHMIHCSATPEDFIPKSRKVIFAD